MGEVAGRGRQEARKQETNGGEELREYKTAFHVFTPYNV